MKLPKRYYAQYLAPVFRDNLLAKFLPRSCGQALNRGNSFPLDRRNGRARESVVLSPLTTCWRDAPCISS